MQEPDAAEANRALREMLSSGRLSKLMPIRVEGQFHTVTINQDGPIAYVETTTQSRIFDEDRNRCVLLTTDETPEQTRRIITHSAKSYAGTTSGGSKEEVIARHHAMQRTLRSHVVIVPFAEQLGKLLPNACVEVRRAWPQLVSMITASALLHQRQREIDSDGRLLASTKDYEWAKHLLALPMGRQLGGGVSLPATRFLERLREWFGPQDRFTSADVLAKENHSKSSVYGWLSELNDAGLVEKLDEQRGNKPALWRLSSEAPDPSALEVLPSVEDICP